MSTDEVDKIIASWNVQRPDLDVDAMHIFSRITRLARHLDLKRREAFADHGLEPWEFDVLSSLRRSGEPFALTPGTLMTELLISSGTMTNRIDRLEARGLVERSRSTDDRRTVTVTLTSAGLEHVDGALITLLECEEELLAPLNSEQRQQLRELLRPVLTPFSNH